jgi:hypothetical protein
MTFGAGLLLPTHPSTTTRLAVLTTKVPQRGSIVATPSTVGRPLGACCGSTENVMFLLSPTKLLLTPCCLVAGSGKSILRFVSTDYYVNTWTQAIFFSSVIIQEMASICNTGFASMAYFYFDFKDTGKQDFRALLSSLLIQLSNQSDVYCDILLALYSIHRRGSVQPNDDALAQCLKTMLVALRETPIYLIVDALDECVDTSGMPSPRENVLQLVRELVDLKLSSLYLCLTSRPEIDIRKALEPLATHHISLHDESGQKADIIHYVRSVVYSDRRMRRWRTEERDMVVWTLSARADGM